LLPVYNGEPYLREAVESVLAQTFSDFELLALDDGSADRSLAILREYEAKDERVRVISRENRGLVPTLNELIAQARGRYLARMDADDICLPERFERQAAFLDGQAEHVAVGGWVELMNADGLPIGIIRPLGSHEEIDPAHLKGFTSIWHPASLIRASAMAQIGGYHDEFKHAEDLDLWLRLGEIGKLANLPKVVLRYRLQEKSVSQENVIVQQQASQRACIEAWRRRGVQGQFEAVEPWRPVDDGASRHEFALRYGWAAWKHGHRRTWCAYAWEALQIRPFAISTWRLVVFGFFKRPH
jgi:glycosyltransferase involved in cell wall biosynthesis